MRLYYFDVHDGETFSADDIGIECAGMDEVPKQAVKALPEMARDELPDGDIRDFAVDARDEAGRRVLKATLSLRVERYDPESGPTSGGSAARAWAR
jgi:hypothetical protein